MRARALFIVLVGLPLLSTPFASAQSTDEYPHGDLALDCGECHDPDSWVPVDAPPTFRHDSTGFDLLASHEQVACADCHRTLVFDHVGIACGDCHKDAHRGELGFRCESCHTPTTWTNQREMFQAHNRTRFPLMGIHARLDCTACHRDQRPYQYANTPAECGTCHYETYVQTTNPNHVQAGFSRRCEDCHTVTSISWRGARTDHPASFPLVGRHGLLACAQCHEGGRYQGLSTDCLSCHRADFTRTTNPNHGAGGFPTSCEDCHTINGWRPATFDHAQGAFPLTGAHGRVDCGSCHVGGRYTGTPTDCNACHQTDYDRTTNPNHRASGLPTRCQDCHNTGSWRPANFDHNATRFRLTGAHDRVDCTRCHTGGRYAGTPTDCNACHQTDYAATTNPNHQASGFPLQCQSCHNTNAWRPAANDHNATRFPLTGAHTRVDCTRCHTGGRYTGTPTDCNACHQTDYAATTNPNHQASGFPLQCQSCHNTNAWRPANIDHSATRFPLTGAHTRVDCTRCHTGGRYAGTPTDCNACHQADYAATTNPNHQASGFPLQCQSCHNTNAWRPANIDHSATRFPLTGAHTRVDCTRCHTGGRYTGTPTDCNACHQTDYAATTNPNHQASGFPLQCQSCHNTNAWRPANIDHSATRFPLTGAHTRVDCTRCHTGGRYTGTPTDCNACHQTDYAATTNPNHQAAGFPIQCQSCHTTSAWRPASFDHDGRYFPIYSGKHRGKWSSCADCHLNPGNYRAFECLLCHEHSNKAEVDDKHKEEPGYAYQSAACLRCHPTGRKESFGSPHRLP